MRLAPPCRPRRRVRQEASLAHRTQRHSLRTLIQRVRGGRLEPRRTGLSVAIGFYVGVQPVFGLHLPLCLLICLPLRLDALIAYAAANISNPLLAGLIIFAEVQIGSLVTDARLLPLTVAQVRQIHWARLALQTAIGAQLLGIVLAIFGGVVAARLAHLAIARRARHPSTPSATALTHAVARTIERYRAAAAGDRNYVACKLRWDPITRVLGDLRLDWGSLLDVGCGRGQLSLLLVELGHARRVFGLDWDARKIEVARRAAGADAQFEVADVAAAALRSCDSALLIDVLHYLAPGAQLELLRQVRDRLVPGGALVIREVDARRTWRSRLTRLFEVLGTRLGVNRGRQLYFQPSAQLQSQLVELGFAMTGTTPMPGVSLDNVLLVARKT